MGRITNDTLVLTGFSSLHSRDKDGTTEAESETLTYTDET